jgi:hypothetical protein
MTGNLAITTTGISYAGIVLTQTENAGSTYGGGIKGFSVTGQGGRFQAGTLENNIFKPAFHSDHVQRIGLAGYVTPTTAVAWATGTTLAGHLTANNAAESYRLGIVGYNDAGSNSRCDIQFGTTVGTGGSDSYIAFWTNTYGSSYAERMRIDRRGYVGINAPNPNYLLHIISGRVFHQAAAEGYSYGCKFDATTPGVWLGSNSSNQLAVSTEGGAVMATINSNGIYTTNHIIGSGGAGSAATDLGRVGFSNTTGPKITFSGTSTAGGGVAEFLTPTDQAALRILTTREVSFGSNVFMPNATAMIWANTSGVSTAVLQKYTNNNVYLDNMDGDIYLRAYSLTNNNLQLTPLKGVIYGGRIVQESMPTQPSNTPLDWSATPTQVLMNAGDTVAGMSSLRAGEVKRILISGNGPITLNGGGATIVWAVGHPVWGTNATIVTMVAASGTTAYATTVAF